MQIKPGRVVKFQSHGTYICLYYVVIDVGDEHVIVYDIQGGELIRIYPSFVRQYLSPL
mgnify:CR=1 FL=1